MSSRALQHFLERAAHRHGERFDDWFPPSFDWQALAEDAPEMARRAGAEIAGLPDERGLQEAAAAIFRAAHLAALAVMCASAEGDVDPDDLLDRITRPPDEDEEQRIEALAAGGLGPVEEAMASDAGADGLPGGDEGDAARALGIARLAWSGVEEPVARALAEGQEGETELSVLLGIARVATVLAAFRWISAAEANENWPPLPSPEDDSDGAPWE